MDGLVELSEQAKAMLKGTQHNLNVATMLQKQAQAMMTKIDNISSYVEELSMEDVDAELAQAAQLEELGAMDESEAVQDEEQEEEAEDDWEEYLEPEDDDESLEQGHDDDGQDPNVKVLIPKSKVMAVKRTISKDGARVPAPWEVKRWLFCIRRQDPKLLFKIKI